MNGLAAAAFANLSPANMGVIVVVCCLLSLYWGLLIWGWRKDRAERLLAAARPSRPVTTPATVGGAFKMGSVEAFMHAQVKVRCVCYLSFVYIFMPISL